MELGWTDPSRLEVEMGESALAKIQDDEEGSHRVLLFVLVEIYVKHSTPVMSWPLKRPALHEKSSDFIAMPASERASEIALKTTH